MRGRETLYFVEVRGAARLPITLFATEAKDTVMVGPHTRVCGGGAAAYFRDNGLAEQYADALSPILRRRHGPETEVLVSTVTVDERSPEARDAEEHERIVRARLATKNMAPNKRVGL